LLIEQRIALLVSFGLLELAGFRISQFFDLLVHCEQHQAGSSNLAHLRGVCDYVVGFNDQVQPDMG
jgi:hypothetical protein